MKHLLVYILMFAFFTSCTPLSFAPNIKTDKVKLAKRFKRDLPKQHGFIFEDPKKQMSFIGSSTPNTGCRELTGKYRCGLIANHIS